MEYITRLEEVILITILRLEGDAYGVPITRQVSETTGKKYSMGALYSSLDQLNRKGYVSKSTISFAGEARGRSRTYYSLTSEGRAVLRDVRSYQQALWADIPSLTEAEKPE
jgi:DNA-binding PadR family transcriptional regulator